ncbi:hypothetical protein D3C71_1816950 [compost metagenome]
MKLEPFLKMYELVSPSTSTPSLATPFQPYERSEFPFTATWPVNVPPVLSILVSGAKLPACHIAEPFQRGVSPCLMVISLLAARSVLHTRHRPALPQPPMNDCSAPWAPKPTSG